MRVAFTVLIAVTTVAACGADDPTGETRTSVSTSPSTDQAADHSATSATASVTAVDRDGTVADDGPDPRGGVDGPVMYAFLVDGEQDSSMAAIIGTLELEGDCLYVSDNGSRVLVLWEYGANWDESTSSVVRADGTSLPIGSELDAGGGYMSIDTFSDVINNDVVVQLARQCAAEPTFEIAMIN